MAKAERVLRVSGAYYRNPDKSEEEFYEFLSRSHGVECAKVHEKYGILKYQMAFTTPETRALLTSMGFPYGADDHDLHIEYYIKEPESLVNVSSDERFRALHIECEPYVDMNKITVDCSLIQVYLENNQLVNIDSEGKSEQLSFKELSDIKVSDKPIAEYAKSKPTQTNAGTADA
ncbi:hypothetical protein O1611_g12 [Lasiodiplodia mahajangana]|uniref:Uncharacterized protein n=1 Tax=Lasiodiplodia mahajangana TaxID=1108764 RepID=A0ACC2K1I3_9PEZI|nr:hypothetical protein O1611_g12 [Lasiodiplodia mahajangana]